MKRKSTYNSLIERRRLWKAELKKDSSRYSKREILAAIKEINAQLTTAMAEMRP